MYQDFGKKKYLRGIFSKLLIEGVRNFGRGLQEVKCWYERGRGCTVNCGERVKFRKDVWLGDCALKTSFPHLYQIYRERQCSVADAWERDWSLEFRRNLGQEEMVEWADLSGRME